MKKFFQHLWYVIFVSQYVKLSEKLRLEGHSEDEIVNMVAEQRERDFLDSVW